jgi:hypothetical protein
MNLKEFIIYLGQNPYKVIEAKENADALMQELGLSQEDQAILKSGDLDRIGAAIAEGLPDTGIPILS